MTTFKDEDEALAIANDTLYGLGAGVWTRDGNRAYRLGRAIQAGRVWTNCYHLYPAHAAFGGYKQSGIGRENAQDDARPLPADQEHAGQLQPEGAGLLLILGDFGVATIRIATPRMSYVRSGSGPGRCGALTAAALMARTGR